MMKVPSICKLLHQLQLNQPATLVPWALKSHWRQRDPPSHASTFHLVESHPCKAYPFLKNNIGLEARCLHTHQQVKQIPMLASTAIQNNTIFAGIPKMCPCAFRLTEAKPLAMMKLHCKWKLLWKQCLQMVMKGTATMIEIGFKATTTTHSSNERCQSCLP